jgi:AbrB family looped-hinge helix DNA binding protein
VAIYNGQNHKTRLFRKGHLPAALPPLAPEIASTHHPCYGQSFGINTVTISPKFQAVIPQAIRESLRLVPGEKLRVIRHSNRVELIPFRPVQEMRGFLKNMETHIEREEDRL